MILSGHNHQYERFAPQDLNRHPDPNGIRAFVAGTGGAGEYGFGPPQPNSEVRGTGPGVLKFTLMPASYRWQFIPVPGGPSPTPAPDSVTKDALGGAVRQEDVRRRMGVTGIQAATPWLQTRCSPAELPPQSVQPRKPNGPHPGHKDSSLLLRILIATPQTGA